MFAQRSSSRNRKRKEHEGFWAFAKREQGTSLDEEGTPRGKLVPCHRLVVTTSRELSDVVTAVEEDTGVSRRF